STTDITPALRIVSPSTFSISTFISPAWNRLISTQGCRRPVSRTTGPPKSNRVPAGRASRSIPAVVTFSPRSPAPTSWPRSRTSSNSSDWMRWTWRRLRRFGSLRTSYRCCTSVPACASPITPIPATSSIASTGCLLNPWVSSRLTDTTRGVLTSGQLDRDQLGPVGVAVGPTHLRVLDADGPHLGEDRLGGGLEEVAGVLDLGPCGVGIQVVDEDVLVDER